jgi:flagellar operon protein
MSGQILYPNVTSLPGQSGLGASQPAKDKAVKGEFDQVFEQEIGKAAPTKPATTGLSTDLGQIRNPLKFSAHASQRLQERKINMDQKMMQKMNEAIDKAEAKGLDDALVLSNDAAFIVNVKNRTVVTAMDRGSLNGNVFTNIDGAVMI